MNKSIKCIAYAVIFAVCQSQVMAKEPHMKCMNKYSERHCNRHICEHYGGYAGIITIGNSLPFGVTKQETRKVKECHRKGKKYVCVCSK